MLGRKPVVRRETDRVMRLIGVDFTSAPSRRKPITVAVGSFGAASAAGPQAMSAVHVHELLAFTSLPSWQDWLTHSGPWIGGFDFPFGLPRAFVRDGLRWPIEAHTPWPAITRRLAALSRPELIAHCKAWCDARPAGSKFAHRATDVPAGSSPSMKWVNPPVVLMLHAGAPALLACGATVPGLHEDGTDPTRIALEAYPGLLARSVLGRTSYKSDDPSRRLDPQRRAARERLVASLEWGAHLFQLPVNFADGRDSCLEDAGADRLDAVLCLAQAAWAAQQRASRWGLPADFDAMEGWIVGAQPQA
jgi:hypothetical protein